ncbi:MULTISPECIES: VIT1/CCC1 transporter family protein [Subtercola]|uniref:VIT family protein n=1 Tax=Subtercola vilae TaxID=2056433 RepID=A0A4T2C8W0_9MICO|nr:MULTISPECIES: VIT1/CCC1 transporter family protein [Subtercola]MEA9986241.1 VIT1/CCC1 transporter family protein [Subtercola sp. RTI3]TIH39066.1 hypothetical protein D4765_05815 [Subtercola vilae]
MTRQSFLRIRLPVLGNLSPGETLPEIVVGLVMVVGITSTARLDAINTDEGVQSLLTVAFSTAVAWAIIDAALYLMNALFQRGRWDLAAHTLRESPLTPEQRRSVVRDALDSSLDDITGPAPASTMYDEIARIVPTERFPERLKAADFRAAAAIVVVVLVSTFPPIIPFLLPLDPDTALDVSNGVGIASLFLVGVWWAPYTRIKAGVAGVALALIGSAMVGITVILEVT